MIDKFNQPELIKAVKSGNLNLVQEIFYKLNNSEINDKKWQTAILYSNKEILEFLIQNGADINTKDDGGWTSLMIASFNFELDKVELLLEKGVKVNEIEQFGQTALILCLVQGELGLSKEDEIKTDKIIQLLIEYGADINIKDTHGKTALDYAKRKEHIELLKNH
ncbi:ankyrin repeat domain-containing protein [Candidatus Gracilibacteria bacterium]|nr:ankyrin repeat domain-containing protein [Candidatus Gracilibacteria bacterium]